MSTECDGLVMLVDLYYCIAQNFRWIKISLNAHALYWYKN